MPPLSSSKLTDVADAASKGQIRQANEALILAAAERVFAGAGLPKANLHYYFGSKQALYRTVLDRPELSAQDHARATEHVVSLLLRGCGL